MNNFFEKLNNMLPNETKSEKKPLPPIPEKEGNNEEKRENDPFVEKYHSMLMNDLVNKLDTRDEEDEKDEVEYLSPKENKDLSSDFDQFAMHSLMKKNVLEQEQKNVLDKEQNIQKHRNFVRRKSKTNLWKEKCEKETKRKNDLERENKILKEEVKMLKKVINEIRGKTESLFESLKKENEIWKKRFELERKKNLIFEQIYQKTATEENFKSE